MQNENKNMNPYRAPQAHVADTASMEYGEVKVFSVQGRIGRVRYLAYLGAMSLLLIVALIPISIISAFIIPTAPVLFWVVYVGVIAVLTVISTMWIIQRCHDFNASGWWAVLNFIPIVNLIFFFVLLLVPGTLGENRFAKQPPPNTGGLVVLAVMPIVSIFVFGILAAIAIPTYQDYVKRARAAQTAPR